MIPSFVIIFCIEIKKSFPTDNLINISFFFYKVSFFVLFLFFLFVCVCVCLFDDIN